jgi:AcrR family transcriptional regulator
MARPSKFTDDDILDGARDAVLAHGLDATLTQVAATVGAPTGSIYHRFVSREHLMVALWLRSVRRFHVSFLSATTAPDAHQALLECAVQVLRYCRASPADARAMMLFRHSTLAETAPESLRAEVRTVNDPVWAALASLAGRRYPGRADAEHVTLVRTAVVQAPYGLVRPYVGGPVPERLDALTRAAVEGMLALGDVGAEREPRRRGGQPPPG